MKTSLKEGQGLFMDSLSGSDVLNFRELAQDLDQVLFAGRLTKFNNISYEDRFGKSSLLKPPALLLNRDYLLSALKRNPRKFIAIKDSAHDKIIAKKRRRTIKGFMETGVSGKGEKQIRRKTSFGVFLPTELPSSQEDLSGLLYGELLWVRFYLYLTLSYMYHKEKSNIKNLILRKYYARGGKHGYDPFIRHEDVKLYLREAYNAVLYSTPGGPVWQVVLRAKRVLDWQLNNLYDERNPLFRNISKMELFENEMLYNGDIKRGELTVRKL